MSSTVKYPRHPVLSLPFYVDVTSEYLRRGIAADCKKCPIAVALINAGFCGVEVGNGGIVASGFEFGLSYRVVQFIDDIDNEKLVESQTLSIDYDTMTVDLLT